MTRQWQPIRREGGTADIREGCWVRLRDGREMGPVNEHRDGWFWVRTTLIAWLPDGRDAFGDRENPFDITHVSISGSKDD